MPGSDDPVRSVDQLGQSLKQIREEKGLSQAVLADRTGVTQKQISKIENGKTNPSTKTIFLLLSELEYELRLAERPKESASGIKMAIRKIRENLDADA